VAAVARVVLALWIGAVAGVSFVVAPRVFQFLDDPRRAGELMRPIFARVDYFGLAAALVFVVAARRSRLRALLAAGIGGLAAVNVFGLAPRIAARGEHFELLHRASVWVWGSILLGGAILLVLGPERRRR